MIIVTGGAGFIGANLVSALNERGIADVVVVDDLTRGEKVANLVDCEIADYLDKDAFRADVEGGHLPAGVEVVFHQGACSDTTESDGRYMMDNNYRFTRALYGLCREQGVRFIYASSASVYGVGPVFAEAPEHERPLNVYAYSKTLFDRFVRRVGVDDGPQTAGLRYFNVYGPREQHKGRMASMAFHCFYQYRNDGKVRLFEGSGGYGPGEQRRDFVHVDDVVAVNLFFLDHPDAGGVFNVGTGCSQTFNDVARTVINGCRRQRGEAPLPLGELQARGLIEYVPFPTDLAGRYQSYTEADLTRLRAVGYGEAFLDVEQGVGRYVEHLLGADREVDQR